MAAFLEELKLDAERNGHRASVVFRGPPVVTVRPAAFKRCLGNLVSNAARFARTISITGQRDHRYLSVTVDDDGPGIPPEMREDVFKPFLRLDDARNQDQGGTGLGLAIARDIARSHGGDIMLGDSPLGGLRATEGCRWGWPAGIVACGRRDRDVKRALRRFLFLVAISGGAGAARADAFGDGAQIVEEPDPALGAGETPVERGHGAVEASPPHRRPRPPARARTSAPRLAPAARRAGRTVDAGGFQHPASASAPPARRAPGPSGGSRRAERSIERTPSL